ncbi:extracellular solute-binding protein [Paenibacillus allorhizosphaerae]|uniref:Extracellular solute-binding protein n=1 Tax=Paenibacillus allorhizosphaerae TaxID=2849866 RepID=A0ABN7TA84_9BACL|nr:extracellular solute-binding protein [Paenibacillus allorhizosphaerae]CAG7614680.1 hypothetical protein PAECIP111802_00098 [Paenibacillus allorhizosphaerae]
MKGKNALYLAALGAALISVIICMELRADAPPSLSPPEEVNQADSNGKYLQPVTLRIGYYTTLESKWPEGSSDTFSDNRYTRRIENMLNIRFVHAFEYPSSDYTQKVNLLISSKNIPDFLLVTEAQFKRLAEAGMVEDMTELYEQHASPLLKNVIQGFGPRLMRRVTYNGRLLGIPSTIPAHDADGVVWIRQDWLRKIGMQLPEAITIADLERVAKAFIEDDPDGNGIHDTHGIQSTSSFLTGTIGFNTLDPYFGAFKAFPRIWIKSEDGNIVYGSITANTKQALGKLHDLYEAGLIDQDFGTVKPDQFAKDISIGKAGIGTGYTSAPMKLLAGSVKNNPAAEWDAHYIVAPDGKYYTRQPDPLGRIMVVKKGAKYPEAIVKAINVVADLDNNAPGVPHVYMDSPGTNWSVRPIQATFRKEQTVVNRFKRFKDAADGKLPREQLLEPDRKIFDDYLKGFGQLVASPQDWAYVLYQYHGGSAVLSSVNIPVYSEFYGMTSTMENQWENLLNLENESFVRIIVGDKPLDYFDTFVAEWREHGGDVITQEVEEAIAAIKRPAYVDKRSDE